MNVRTLCLGILYFRDASGYQIKKASQEGPFRHIDDASFGSIYPALTRLTKEGLVSRREEQQSGKPDRKVYSITERGRAALSEALAQAPAADKLKSEFLFHMICADLLDADTIARKIDRRLEEHGAEIVHLEEALAKCDRPASRFVIGYGLAVYRAAHDYLAARREEAVTLAQRDDAAPEAAE